MIQAISENLGSSGLIADPNAFAERLVKFASGYFELLGEANKIDFTLQNHEVIVYEEVGKRFILSLRPKDQCDDTHKALTFGQLLTTLRSIFNYKLRPNDAGLCSEIADALLKMAKRTNDHHRSGLSGFLNAALSAVSIRRIQNPPPS